MYIIIIIIIKFVFSPWDFYSLGQKNNNNYYYYYYSYFLLPRAKFFFIIIILLVLLFLLYCHRVKPPLCGGGLKCVFFRCLNINISEKIFLMGTEP